jgi:hypothetical protein
VELPRVLPFNDGMSEFCIARMVSKIGLLRIGVTRDLRAAKTRMEELVESWPGEYVVFRQSTGRVVAKTSGERSRRRDRRRPEWPDRSIGALPYSACR